MCFAELAESVSRALHVVLLEQCGKIKILVAVPTVRVVARRIALVYSIVLLAEERLVASAAVNAHDERKEQRATQISERTLICERAARLRA